MTVFGLTKHSLVAGTTPLEFASRLSEQVGVEIWFKRDDLTGRGLGGNKVRTLEFLLGDAVENRCDSLVTGAGPQSNWAMLAALTAIAAGMEAHLTYYGTARKATGNLLLARSAGAHIHFTGSSLRESVDAAMLATARSLKEAGRRPYVVPRGGAMPVGCLGYASASQELHEQALEAGIYPHELWLPTGSCGTQAGLLAGTHWLGWEVKIVGVTVSRSTAECVTRISDLAAGTLALLGVPEPQHPRINVVTGYIGPGYGLPSPAGLAAAALVAKTEGIFLDPVFGGKAMAALIEGARSGTVRGPVVFLVTGGAPTLFAEGTDL